MIDILKQRYIQDKVSSETKAFMEELFIKDQLDNEDYNYIFPFNENDKSCDATDERLDILNKFYKSIESVGIHIFQGYSGSREDFIGYADNLLKLEQKIKPFIIVEHNLDEHLKFLRYGELEIGWQLYSFPGFTMENNGIIAEYIQFEAKRFGFWVPEISVKDERLKLIYCEKFMGINISPSSSKSLDNPYSNDIGIIMNESKPSFGSHLKGFKFPKPEDAHDTRVLSNIKNFGYHIVGIRSEDGEPEYCFTIGLEYSYKHPEILLVGLPISTANTIITKMGSEIKNDQKFTDENNYIKIASQKFMVKEVHPSNYDDYLGYYLWFYRSLKTPPLVMQLFWPDESDKFPWDDGYNEKFDKSQPLLFQQNKIL